MLRPLAPLIYGWKRWGCLFRCAARPPRMRPRRHTPPATRPVISSEVPRSFSCPAVVSGRGTQFEGSALSFCPRHDRENLTGERSGCVMNIVLSDGRLNQAQVVRPKVFGVALGFNFVIPTEALF